MLNFTNISSHDSIYPGLQCILVDSVLEKSVIFCIYCFCCLFPTGIGLYAIVVHYCKSNNDMLVKLRICDIIATINFVLFCIDMVVDLYFALSCDLSTNSYLSKYDNYGTICFCIGYYTLYWIFALKLKHSFKNSLFEVSKLSMNVITVIGIIGTLLAGIVIILLSTESFYVTENNPYDNAQFAYYIGISFGLSMLFYIVGHLLLSYQLFSNFYQYLNFATLAGGMNIDTTCTIDNRLNNSQNKNVRLYQAFIRLMIVYTCAVLSTFMVIIVLVILFDIEANNHDIIFSNQVAIWFRLILMIDQTINICCLLFQNDSAIYFYKKACCLCHACVTQIVKKSIIKSKGDKAINVNTAPSSETQD